MAQPAPVLPGKQRLGEMLIRDGQISQEQLNRALEEQRAFGGRLGRHLVDLGFLSDNSLLDALSKQLRIPRVDLDAPGIMAADASRYARADLAEQWGFVPVTFDQKRNVLIVAVSDPDPQLLVDIEGFLAMRVEPRIASAEMIDRVQKRLFHNTGEVKRIAGLQVSRGEAKNGVGGNPPNLSAPPAPAAMSPPGPPPQPVAQQVNPYEAQMAAQQVALQMQLQQMQLQAQQVVAQQAAAQQAAQHAAAQQAAAQQAAAQQAAMQNGMAYANGYGPPPGYGGYTLPPKPMQMMPQGQMQQQMQQMPPQMAPAPRQPVPGTPTLEELADQLNRLEKTLSAQARAMRSLVEVLVEKGVFTKAEMAKKQQQNAK